MRLHSKCVAVAFLWLVSVSTGGLQAQEQRDQQLLEVRKAVWLAWFANDTRTLHDLVPADTVVISGGEKNFKHQAEVFRSAAEFQTSGNKLVRLDFTHTEVQHFGDVAVVWSDYRVETAAHRKHSISTGRASEIFVRRNGKWINPGWHTDSTN